MSRRPTRLGLTLAAPLGALVLSLALSAVFLAASGHSPLRAYGDMWEFGTRGESIVSALNRAVPLYLSALAVALAFKVKLFNIGVEGQYLVAAVVAAWAGAAVELPAVLHVGLIVVVAMAVGGAWATVPALLKVYRGVHEVISTIMFNLIASGFIAWLLIEHLGDPDSDLSETAEIAPSGHVPDLDSWLGAVGLAPERGRPLNGALLLAVVAGVVFYVVVWRTRFGFDLRAAGENSWAATASGVRSTTMVLRTMILSGALAGLVGLPELLGFSHQYGNDFTTNLGFDGIAVALLGRGNPIGMAAGALLFGALERSGQVLDLEGVPAEIVSIMQGIILIAVVVAYEIVARIRRAREASQTAAAVDRPAGGPQRAEVGAPV